MFISTWQPHTPTHTNVVCKSTKSQWDAFGNHRRWAGCWRAGNWKQRLIGLISPSDEFPRQMDWRQLAGDFDTVLGMMGKFLCIFVSSVIPPFIFLLLSKSGWSLFQPILPPVTWKSVWLVCWRLSHIVEQKRRLVWGATVVYCKTCFFLPWCVNEERYTSVTYKLSSNWESTQKVRVFFHIEEEITALQRKQLCRINLLPLLLNSSLEQLSQYVKCQLHWLLAPPFSSSSPLLVSQVRWTKCTERMPRKGIKDVQNLVTRKQDRRQKQNFDTYTKITNLMWKIMQKMFFKLMAEKT